MKTKDTKRPYPRERLGELEKYKEKLLAEDGSEDQGLSSDIYRPEIIESKIIQFKRQEAVSPILKRLVTSEQPADMMPLRKIGSDVVGSLFDRVKFLRERIAENNAFMEDRKRMNERFNKDIDADIAEMGKIIPGISDREELRQFKINLNLLKMEKRKENNLFWRDMVSLKNQLRELNEQFEVESKIAELFSDLDV